MEQAIPGIAYWLPISATALGAVTGAFLPRVVHRFEPGTEQLEGAAGSASSPRAGAFLGREAPRSAAVMAVTTAALFALMGVHFGLSWQLPAHLFLVAVAVVLAVIDLRHHLLPNAVVMPALGIGFLLLALAAGGDQAWGALGRAVLGALVLFVFYLVLALISPAGLGMGDVKLAAVLGLFLGYQGWDALLVGALLASVVGAVVGVGVLAARRGGLRSDVPFGPSMLAGALVAIVWGERLAREHLLPGLY